VVATMTAARLSSGGLAGYDTAFLALILLAMLAVPAILLFRVRIAEPPKPADGLTGIET